MVRDQEQNSNRFPTNSKTERRADFDDRLPFRDDGHYRFKREDIFVLLYVVVLLKIIALFLTLAIIVLLRPRRRLVDKHGY